MKIGAKTRVGTMVLGASLVSVFSCIGQTTEPKPVSQKSRKDVMALYSGRSHGDVLDCYVEDLVAKANLAAKANKDPNVVLFNFIDAVHNFIDYDDDDDDADLCKVYLDRHQARTVGATTLEEFEKNIGKDDALERRFCQIFVSEPGEKEISVRDFKKFAN